ncbi:23S rRNA (guanosine(2251)-2'-O)-methyltransferase RlmB [Humidesulfovibrio sp.]
MADSKKTPRPKGPRTPSKSGSGWSTSKPGGKNSDGSGARSGDDRRSGPSSRPSSRPGRGPARGPAKNAPGDPRVTGGYGKAPQKKAPQSTARVDDFDFDIDVDMSDAPPAAFPKPARPANTAGDTGSRPPRRSEGSDRGDRPAKFTKADRYDKPGRPARPGAAETPRPTPRNAEAAAEPEDGKSVTAGRNAVRELLEAAPKRIDGIFVRKGQRDAKVQEIVALADENRIKVQFVDDMFLRRLFAGTHQGVVAVTAAVEYADLDTLIASVVDAPLPVLLALDQVQDPGNMGAIARTAWALGAAGLLVPRHGGAYIGAGAMRASAGALHHLPVARVTNMSQALDACAEAGLNILCADSEGENLNSAIIHMPAVLVMGGEEKGVRHGVSKHCQQRLAIPLRRTFDSLNVAQAAAICLARLGQVKG